MRDAVNDNLRDSSEECDSGLALIQEDVKLVAKSLADVEKERLAGKTVLITGARGLLASYLADTLALLNRLAVIREPLRLILLVRSPPRGQDRLAHLADRADVEFVFQDACDPLSVSGPVHFIIHAASPASPKWYRRDPVGCMDANSIALRQLLELARERRSEGFLYFSSSEVYGTPDPDHIPTEETYEGRVDFMSGRACYAESKRFGETLCRSFFEQFGVPTKIVRPFHIHGPGLRLDDGRIIAELTSQGLENRGFALLSDGHATRTYGYVSDATAGFLKVLLAGAEGEAFNVGADSPEISILELARTMAQLFGRNEPVQVNLASRPTHLQGAPDRACPDLAKIRRLGYAPAVTLVAGLERTIAWHKAQLQPADLNK